MRRKFYVVWAGWAPGVYDTWEECQAQVKNYPGAKYRAYATQEEAVAAYRGDPREQSQLLKVIAAHRPQIINYDAFPEIRVDAIAVDGACAGNPGPMEYRGVRVGTGEQVFHLGPLDGGTNNIGEYLALVHALSLLARNGDGVTPVYSDSRTGMAWLRQRHSKTQLARTAANARVFELLERADRWVAANSWTNPVIKWDTERWGEIPADFGRK